MLINVRTIMDSVKEADVDVPDDATYNAVLSYLEINPETVIVMENGIPVANDEIIQADAEITVLRIVSGG